MKVFKYPLGIFSVSEIDLPRGYKLLHVGLDPSGVPCVWALVDEKAEKKTVQFHVVGTGHTMPDRVGPHLGSFVHGPFVWHVFTL